MCFGQIFNSLLPRLFVHILALSIDDVFDWISNLLYLKSAKNIKLGCYGGGGQVVSLSQAPHDHVQILLTSLK